MFGKKLKKKRNNKSNKEQEMAAISNKEKSGKINSEETVIKISSLPQVTRFIETDLGPYKTILTYAAILGNSQKPPSNSDTKRILHEIDVKYVEIKRIGKIKWAVLFESRLQANIAMEKPWKKSKYRMEIPWFLVYRNVVIERIPLDTTMEKLEEEIRKSNPLIPVVALFRVKKKVRRENLFELAETESVKITVRSTKCPSHFVIWEVRTPVSPYVLSIRRCFKCGQLDHITKFCKNSEICLRCGETLRRKRTEHQDCTRTARCVNCKGPHRSLHPKCPEVIDQITIYGVMAEYNIGYIEAKEMVRMRGMLNDLKKSLDDKERVAKVAVANTVVETAQSIIQSKVGCQVLIEVLEAYSNTKALDSALKKIRALSPKTSALLISVDQDVKKIFALTSVPKSAVSKGLKANEWIQAITPMMQGKGGGKSESAQASGTNIACLNEIISKANEFANQKLGITDNKAANDTFNISESDNQSLNTEHSTNLVLYANVGSTKCYLAQIIAQYSGKRLSVKQIDNDKTSSSSVMLETGDVTLRNGNAIAFFLSNSQLRRDDDLCASSQVLQWVSYSQNHILPAVIAWVLPALEVSTSKLQKRDTKANAKLSKEDLLHDLKRLDSVLHTRTYLVGERITLADISVFAALLPLYEHVFDPHHRKSYTNLNRWFSTILNQPQVRAVVKNFVFCAKAARC